MSTAPPEPDPSVRSRRGHRRLGWILLLTLVAWAGSIVRGGFSYDDREVLFGNPVVEGEVPWTRAFTQDYWHHSGPVGHYRPLATLSLRLDRGLWGELARGYHATNVLLHLAVVAAAGVLAMRAAGPWPWLGLMVFALHPVLADSVAWLSGRTSMVSALGGLLGGLWVVAATRGGGGGPLRMLSVAVGSALGLLAALLGKEDGVVFAAMLPLLALRRSTRAAAASGLGCAVALAAYAWLRAGAIDQWLPEALHAPLAGVPLAERLGASGRALAEGLRVAVLPLGYPPRYAAATFEAVTRWDALTASLGWTFLALLVFFGLRRLTWGRGSSVGASALLVALAILPHMQIEPSGVVFAPRFLYLPLLLGVPLVSALVRLLVPSRPARALLPALCVLLVAGAWLRSGVYTSRTSFWEACLRNGAEDAVVWNALGNARKEEGDLEGAEEAWRRALELRPTYSKPANNLGTLYLERGDTERAEELLLRAVVSGPDNAAAHGNLGVLLLRQDRFAEAGQAYGRAVELDPGRAALWRGLARARHGAGDGAGALEAVDQALELDPADGAARSLRRRIAGEDPP